MQMLDIVSMVVFIFVGSFVFVASLRLARRLGNGWGFPQTWGKFFWDEKNE